MSDNTTHLRTVGRFYVAYGYLNSQEKQYVLQHSLTPVFYGVAMSFDVITKTEEGIYAALLTGDLSTTEFKVLS